MRIAVALSLLMVILGISYYYYSRISLKDYEKFADEITLSTAKKLKDEKGLILIGIGGRMMDEIKMLGMGLEYPKEADIEIARKLLVYSVEEYLSEINANKKLRPYLHNYPFIPKNIKIEIYFRNTNNPNACKDLINIAATSEGMISYYVKYPDNNTLKPIKEETYEEALKAIYPARVYSD